jgi:parallel beta-helix repeat protein
VKKEITSITLCLILIISSFVILDFIFAIVNVVEGDTLYVNTTGDSGAFTSIQDAINASSDGDTVFVYSGTYYENVIVNRTINLVGEDKNNTIIDGKGNEDVVYVTSDRVNITGFTTTNSGTLWRDAGLQIDSDYNTISDNNISFNNWYGIFLYYSRDNNIIDNTISSNLHEGILISYSIENILIGNSMIENSIFVGGNILEHWNTHTIDITNTVNGNPVYYLKNQVGGKIPSGAGQVILANSTNVKVESQKLNNGSAGIELGFSSNNIIVNNSISNNSVGLYLYYSDMNNISDNIISYNWNGIYLYTNCHNNILENNSILANKNIGFYISSSNNNIIKNNNCSFNEHTGFSFAITTGKIIKNNICLNNLAYGFHFQICDDNVMENNTISNNSLGLYFWSSSGNEVYHNSFINNTTQAMDYGTDNVWNEDYPSGGNYWSDYTGNDLFKGPNQNISGSDGIGDNPYAIESDSRDKYPLMDPFNYQPWQNYTILKQGWNLISIPLIQEVQSLTKVLEMINGYYDTVQWYNPRDSRDPWKHHKMSKPYGNDLFELNESMGFWIHIINPGDTIFLYNGTQPTENQTITLQKGWNMVGYTSNTNYNLTEGLNNLTFDDQVDAIWTYDASSQKWNEMGESDYFELGRGYYIHTKAKCEWEVPL